MKTKKLHKKLQKLRNAHLYRLKPKNNPRRGAHYEVSIPIANHVELMFLIGNLLKVSILALEEPKNVRDPDIPQHYHNVQEVLRHALHLIPFEEQEFIDAVTELLNRLPEQ